VHPEKPDSQDWMRAVREAGPYLGLGSQLAASVLLGVAAGHFADREFETGPWLLLLGAFMGVAVAMIQLYRTELTRKR